MTNVDDGTGLAHKSWPHSLEKFGWFLILLGFPLCNTTVGQLLLLCGVLGCAGTRQKIEWGDLPRNDTFYRWGWVFLGLSVVSAIQSDHVLIGLSVSLSFFVFLFLIVRGSHVLISAKPYFNWNKMTYAILGSSVIGSSYALYTYFILGWHRATGIGVGINGLGTISAFVALLCFGIGINSMKRNRPQSIFAFFTSALAFITLIFTFSRGAWLGLGFSLAVFLGFRLLTRQIKWRTIGVSVVCVVIAAAVLFTFVPQVQNRLLSAFSVEANFDRVIIWKISLEMIKEHPLFGVGGGAFPFVYDDYRIESESGHTMPFAHNIILQIGAEFGILGLIAFSAIIGIAIFRGWAVARHGNILLQVVYAGYLGILVHELFDNILYGMDIAGLFWMITGLFVHLHHRQKTMGTT